PENENSMLGPLICEQQFDRVQSYIQKGIDEGATLTAGGLGKPKGLETGYYVKPTVFTNVRNNMTTAQEEIFGPVISVLMYDTLDEAIEIANDTIFGLAGYVLGNNEEKLKKVASSIRAGRIAVNNGSNDYSAPFGG